MKFSASFIALAVALSAQTIVAAPLPLPNTAVAPAHTTHPDANEHSVHESSHHEHDHSTAVHEHSTAEHEHLGHHETAATSASTTHHTDPHSHGLTAREIVEEILETRNFGDKSKATEQSQGQEDHKRRELIYEILEERFPGPPAAKPNPQPGSKPAGNGPAKPGKTLSKANMRNIIIDRRNTDALLAAGVHKLANSLVPASVTHDHTTAHAGASAGHAGTSVGAASHVGTNPGAASHASIHPRGMARRDLY